MDFPHMLLIFSVTKHLNQCWGPPRSCSMDTRVLSWGKSDQGMNLTTHLPVVPTPIICLHGVDRTNFFSPSFFFLSPSSLTFSFSLLPSDQQQHSWVLAHCARSQLWLRVQICCRYLLLTIILIITLMITIPIITLPLSPCIFLKASVMICWSSTAIV